jgi:hypothetical protein
MNLAIRIILLIFLLSPLRTYAQEDTIKKYPKVINYMGDTVVVFSFEQGLELADKNEERKECLIRKDILEQRIVQKDIIITQKNEQIQLQDTIIINHQENADSYEGLIELCDMENKKLKKHVRRQKIQKWIAIIGGSAIITLALIF